MIIFESSQAKILEVMQVTASVSDTKQHSILQNAKIEKDGNQLRITGANAELEIIATCDLGGDPCQFAATIPVRKLVGILHSLQSEETVVLVSCEDTLTLWTENTRVNLNTVSAANFPILNFGGNTIARFQLPQRTLTGLIEQVAFAIPAANYRAYLNGACLCISKGTLTLVATDSCMVALAMASVDADLPEVEIILPRKSILELQRWIGCGDEMVDVHLKAGQARFSTGGLDITTRLLEGKFPDFRKVASARPLIAVDAPRVALLNSLRRALVMSKDDGAGVHITLSKMRLTVTSVTNNTGDSLDEIPVNYIGATIATSFNAKYLVDAISNIKGDTLTLAFGPNQAHLHMTNQGDHRFLYVAAQLRT